MMQLCRIEFGVNVVRGGTMNPELVVMGRPLDKRQMSYATGAFSGPYAALHVFACSTSHAIDVRSGDR
jgi:hypothetical protein